MKFSRHALAATLAVPAIISAQAAAPQAKPDMKAAFAAMKANVANISDAAEKERWSANRDAWGAVVSQT